MTRDNLKLFPSRVNPYVISSSPSPTTTSSSQIKSSGPHSSNGRSKNDTLEKPLLINNGNISSTNGRNGVALNQLVTSSSNGTGTPGNAPPGPVNRNGKTQYQRLRPIGVKQKAWRDSFKVV